MLPGAAAWRGWSAGRSSRARGSRVDWRRTSAAARTVWAGHNGWLDLYGLMSLNKLRFFSADYAGRRWPTTCPTSDLGLHAGASPAGTRSTGGCTSARASSWPGTLLSSKGDRVAMHSSVETRYPFLDEDVFAFLAPVHPRWKLRGLRGQVPAAAGWRARWLPAAIAWRRKAMFRRRSTASSTPPARHRRRRSSASS